MAPIITSCTERVYKPAEFLPSVIRQQRTPAVHTVVYRGFPEYTICYAVSLGEM